MNSVTVDFAGASFSLLELNHSWSVSRYGWRRFSAVWMSWWVHVMVMSSAYDDMFISGEGGVGMSCKYRLKSVGDRADPCGTPLVKFLVFDVWPANVTCAHLPAR